MTTMRDFTPFESECIRRGVCPNCGGLSWLDGPRGGEAVNLECVRCHLRVNVCPKWPGWGQVIGEPKPPEAGA
jgi:hypothetical protein